MNKKLYKRNKNINTETQPIPVVKEVVEKTTAPEKKEDPIRKGSKIKFTGEKTYSGIPLDISKTDVFTVIELSGDRVVIGKGTQIIAAVNIKNCKKVN